MRPKGAVAIAELYRELWRCCQQPNWASKPAVRLLFIRFFKNCDPFPSELKSSATAPGVQVMIWATGLFIYFNYGL